MLSLGEGKKQWGEKQEHQEVHTPKIHEQSGFQKLSCLLIPQTCTIRNTLSEFSPIFLNLLGFVEKSMQDSEIFPYIWLHDVFSAHTHPPPICHLFQRNSPYLFFILSTLAPKVSKCSGSVYPCTHVLSSKLGSRETTHLQFVHLFLL